MSELVIAGISLVKADNVEKVAAGFSDRRLRKGWVPFLQRLPELINVHSDRIAAVWATVSSDSTQYVSIVTQSELMIVEMSSLSQNTPIVYSLRVPLSSITHLLRPIMGIRPLPKIEIYTTLSGRASEIWFRTNSPDGERDCARFKSVIQVLSDHAKQMVIQSGGELRSVHAIAITEIDPLELAPHRPGIDTTLVYSAGYGIGCPVELRVMVSTDSRNLLLLDRFRELVYSVPASRYITSDFDGGAFNSGSDVIGGGFGIVGAAVGIASAAAINRLTRKEQVETFWVITTEDGELKFRTEDATPDEINLFISEYRFVSRKATEVAPGSNSASGGQDLVGQLQGLADLRAAGALSDDEFAIAKMRLIENLSM